jgi:AAA+ superfamily predicted ATPase
MTCVSNQYLIDTLDYLRKRIVTQFEQFSESSETTPAVAPVPKEDDISPFARFVREHSLSEDELTVLLVALAPYVLPGFFDSIVQGFFPQGTELPQIGGVKGEHHRGTLPTGETALFVLAGIDPLARLEYIPILEHDAFLIKSGVLSLLDARNNEPAWSGRLVVDPEFVEVFTTGKVALPKLSINFPAQAISTELEWDDLVLSPATAEQIRDIEHWVRHNETLMQDWGMRNRLKPGYRALFYGPPGTGKTLTATLLGKYTGRPVFRVDVATLVSKFIGETEKNLSALFDKAENKQWILFFDEADSIFGKRTGVRDAHDKYANQEVSYLLQRIELFEGLVILTTNFRNNIDHAFIRRFNAIVYFPKPNYEERLSLWSKAFPEVVELEDSKLLEKLAQSFELTGSQIMNIVHHTCLGALARNQQTLRGDDIIQAVHHEQAKHGK